MTAATILASDTASGLDAMLLVGVGGAAGALTRFGIGVRLDADRVPVDVIAVNVLGTFLATLLAVLSPGPDALLFASVGFCGSLTTFSAFSVRTVALWRADRRLAAASFAVGTLLACLLGAGLALATSTLV